ncbi:hypothetical protein BJV74DRAFT_542419 [Russula compacta]|nr:hypothetical protein BJV74DRAFT_542419 [Russula compacta]
MLGLTLALYVGLLILYALLVLMAHRFCQHMKRLSCSGGNRKDVAQLSSAHGQFPSRAVTRTPRSLVSRPSKCEPWVIDEWTQMWYESPHESLVLPDGAHRATKWPSASHPLPKQTHACPRCKHPEPDHRHRHGGEVEPPQQKLSSRALPTQPSTS